MKSQSQSTRAKSKNTAALEAATLQIKAGQEDSLTTFIDLTGLVYANLDHPVILIGLPQEYSDTFQKSFFKRGVQPHATKKASGNRYYTRVSRAADVYRLCKAIDGRTKIHQRAVKAIMGKLEEKYGRQNLEAMI